MDTKEKILFNALEMFSQTGYNTVSIRDIAGAVDIKESSIYYHFKNKQDIFDSIVERYENHIKGLMDILNTAVIDMDSTKQLSLSITFQVIKDYYFEKYLFDPFCNQVMRLMMIEQFHNEAIRNIYNRYLFELPEKIQTETFRMVSRSGVMSEGDAVRISRMFFSVMTMLTFRYMLNGDLTETKKKVFAQRLFRFSVLFWEAM
ncbi:TetR/AcrR family transcriptional regulator [Treponema denticola]|uniref:TetR/AcrR family transcriptional regulator n=1 Tax=Treponema denticola TaxID=158 RepID=UPI0020A36C16|nr:TetR/AcrR family transcriptional regulator [Treponema denticola]UTD06987.1 TetR/AcrR family transcriptional regulator [Treponema denticola]